MNALSKAQSAYSAVSAPTRTTRSTEYEAVSRITRKIQDAARKGPADLLRLALIVLLPGLTLWLPGVLGYL